MIVRVQGRWRNKSGGKNLLLSAFFWVSIKKYLLFWRGKLRMPINNGLGCFCLWKNLIAIGGSKANTLARPCLSPRLWNQDSIAWLSYLIGQLKDKANSHWCCTRGSPPSSFKTIHSRRQIRWSRKGVATMSKDMAKWFKSTDGFAPMLWSIVSAELSSKISTTSAGTEGLRYIEVLLIWSQRGVVYSPWMTTFTRMDSSNLRSSSVCRKSRATQ